MSFPQGFLVYCKIKQLDRGQSKIRYFQLLKSILRPKNLLIILKKIFVLKHQTRRATFSINISSFIHVYLILFSKTVSYFCMLSSKLWSQVSKNPLRMFNWMLRSIEFRKNSITKHRPCLRLCLD